jgi:threonine dehydrogenase-like Zn-dependent dehydrogenase
MLKASESKLLDDDELASLKSELSEDAWLQEMECNFDAAIPGAIYGREMYETWYQMSVLVQSGLDISPVITHRFNYTDFEKGFEAMHSGQSGKVILTWKEG